MLPYVVLHVVLYGFRMLFDVSAPSHGCQTLRLHVVFTLRLYVVFHGLYGDQYGLA